MDRERLRELLAEATVDCYDDDDDDEEEEFTGVLCTLDDRLNSPLRARALGELVEVVGLNDEQSDLSEGRARLDGTRHSGTFCRDRTS